MRLKDIAHINRHVLSESTDSNYTFRYIDISAVDDRGMIVIPAEMMRFESAPSRARRLAPVGSTVVSTVRTYLRAIAQVPVTDEHLIFSTGFAIIEAKSGVDSRFLSYACRSQKFIEEVAAHSVGVSYPAINPSELACIEVPLPTLNEQHRIADFLDAETARIDQLVDTQLRVLNLLEERANARILDIIGQSLLVKRGGAQVTPLRRVIQKVNRPVTLTNEIITAFRDGQVTSRTIRRSDGYTLPTSAEPQGQGVEAGDIVIHGLDGFAGAIGDSEASGNCSPVYHVCTPIDGGNSAFYGRLLRLLALNDYLALFGASARERAVDFRNWKIFGHAPIPQIGAETQCEIGSSITNIRPLREEVGRFNRRLAERRQALITAAVTGKIDVTTAGGAVR